MIRIKLKYMKRCLTLFIRFMAICLPIFPHPINPTVDPVPPAELDMYLVAFCIRTELYFVTTNKFHLVIVDNSLCAIFSLNFNRLVALLLPFYLFGSRDVRALACYCFSKRRKIVLRFGIILRAVFDCAQRMFFTY